MSNNPSKKAQPFKVSHLSFLILTRFVLVKYSCACCLPITRYFLLGLTTYYCESNVVGASNVASVSIVLLVF